MNYLFIRKIRRDKYKFVTKKEESVRKDVNVFLTV